MALPVAPVAPQRAYLTMLTCSADVVVSCFAARLLSYSFALCCLVFSWRWIDNNCTKEKDAERETFILT